jgi:hypothetical protein
MGPTQRMLHPSYFHEIHCLRMLNLALYRVESPYTTLGHSRHCLHYLRTMALCHADMTLETIKAENQSVFEWGTEDARHVCEDWTALYKDMEENQERWKMYQKSHPVRL